MSGAGQESQRKNEGRLLWGWPFLCAMLLLVLNDYLLKRLQLVPLLSGKLSNIAGLFATPVLFFLLLRWIFRRASSRRLALVSIVTVGVVFSLWESSAIFLRYYRYPLDALLSWLPTSWTYNPTPDPTDLFCLPTLGLAYFYLIRWPASEENGAPLRHDS